MSASNAPADRSAGRRAIRFGLVILAVGILVVLVANEIERRGRTETIDAVHPYGALHLAGETLVMTESVGRVISYDVVRRQATTLLEGLMRPMAADTGPDGTVCAVSGDASEARTAWLTCTNGLRVDLAEFEPPDEPVGGPSALLVDVVSDGASGWLVADGGRAILVHVDGDGTVALVSRFPRTGRAWVPRGLDRVGNQVAIALGAGGITSLGMNSRNLVTKDSRWVAGDDSAAIVGDTSEPLVLVTTSKGADDFVTYAGGGADGGRPQIADQLERATGLELMPDGRLAIAANGRLLLVRPTDLPD